MPSSKFQSGTSTSLGGCSTFGKWSYTKGSTSRSATGQTNRNGCASNLYTCCVYNPCFHYTPLQCCVFVHCSQYKTAKPKKSGKHSKSSKSCRCRLRTSTTCTSARHSKSTKSSKSSSSCGCGSSSSYTAFGTSSRSISSTRSLGSGDSEKFATSTMPSDHCSRSSRTYKKSMRSCIASAFKHSSSASEECCSLSESSQGDTLEWSTGDSSSRDSSYHSGKRDKNTCKKATGKCRKCLRSSRRCKC